MNVKKRIISCIILLILLAAICITGLMQRQEIQTMGRSIGNEGGKKIALTFDDGPHPYYTEQLLKGLKERNAKATFSSQGRTRKATRRL